MERANAQLNSTFNEFLNQAPKYGFDGRVLTPNERRDIAIYLMEESLENLKKS